MAPEYGATCGFFPIDAETLKFLTLSGRSQEQVQIIESYAKIQGLFYIPGDAPPDYDETYSINLSEVEPSLAGPFRPQDRVSLSQVKHSVLSNLGKQPTPESNVPAPQHGILAIAAITSCTNTSNPSVMLAAGLLAQKARARGLRVPNWVKTSLAPGSKVVVDYLQQAGLLAELAGLGFHVVGFGCTTCIGNSGPLVLELSRRIKDEGLVACAVLSGNRNFEGRVHAEVRLNYLASPPMVVAYALAGRMDIDLQIEPLGIDLSGQPVYLKELWPSPAEVADLLTRHINPELFQQRYSDVFQGDDSWRALRIPDGELFSWQQDSSYIRQPPYFIATAGQEVIGQGSIVGARVLAVLGDSITTDHISPAGNIKADSPAGHYLAKQGVPQAEFNAYGARRGNHEVMVRGTFANQRLRNRLADGREGGWTRYQPDGELMPIYDAAMRYQQTGVPLLVLAGKEYGSGSSRDWAAKGPKLLGVQAVIAESYERIHRTNLVGMGILPLEFMPGESAASLDLMGTESFTINMQGAYAKINVVTPNGATSSFTAKVRIDTPREIAYYRCGGILPYVLSKILASTT
jgi:aconitate hydratase